MTLFALYMARKRSLDGEIEPTPVVPEGVFTNTINYIKSTLYNLFCEDTSGSDSVSDNNPFIENYNQIKDITIGHMMPQKLWNDSDGKEPVSPEITIDRLLEMIDEKYIIPEGITHVTPEIFKNLDLGGRSQIKVFIEQNTSEFDKRNQFIFIVTGGEYKDRIFGATKLHNMRPDISFIAIDPRFEALFTMLSPLEEFVSEEGHLLDNLVIAAGSKDNHLGYFNKSSSELRFASILGESVFKNASQTALEWKDDIHWWHGEEIGWTTTRPEFPLTSTGTRIERVSRAMTDMLSRVTDHINSPAHPDFDPKNPPASLTDMDRIAKAMRALYPVKHITLAGNALFALSVEKMRTAGVEISVDCVEFNNRTLKSILKDKKQALWASDSWNSFEWQFKHIDQATGESMVQAMIANNSENGEPGNEWFLDIGLFTNEKCPLGGNLVEIFQAVGPYMFNLDGTIGVESIRAMPRITPSEMTDSEIYHILRKLEHIFSTDDDIVN